VRHHREAGPKRKAECSECTEKLKHDGNLYTMHTGFSPVDKFYPQSERGPGDELYPQSERCR